MGGAGLSLTDDSAASWIDPARPGSIGDPELLLEGRTRRFDDLSGDSSFVLADPAVDSVAGTSRSASAGTDGAASPSFIAFAHPLDLTRPRVLSISRVEALDIAIGLRSETRTTPLSAPVAPGGSDEVVRVSRGRLDASMELYHLAAGTVAIASQ